MNSKVAYWSEPRPELEPKQKHIRLGKELKRLLKDPETPLEKFNEIAARCALLDIEKRDDLACVCGHPSHNDAIQINAKYNGIRTVFWIKDLGDNNPTYDRFPIGSNCFERFPDSEQYKESSRLRAEARAIIIKQRSDGSRGLCVICKNVAKVLASQWHEKKGGLCIPEKILFDNDFIHEKCYDLVEEQTQTIRQIKYDIEKIEALRLKVYVPSREYEEAKNIFEASQCSTDRKIFTKERERARIWELKKQEEQRKFWEDYETERKRFLKLDKEKKAFEDQERKKQEEQERAKNRKEREAWEARQIELFRKQLEEERNKEDLEKQKRICEEEKIRSVAVCKQDIKQILKEVRGKADRVDKKTQDFRDLKRFLNLEELTQKEVKQAEDLARTIIHNIKKRKEIEKQEVRTSLKKGRRT